MAILRRRGLAARGGGGASASEQLLTLATDDGWTALYDPTNPDTRTLRDDGGDQYFSAFADGLGNLPDLTQGTAANQPQLSVGAFGQLDGGIGDGAATFMETVVFAARSQPNAITVLFKSNTTTGDKRLISGKDGASAGSGLLYHINNGDVFTGYAGAFLSGGAANTSTHVATFIGNGTSSKLRLDGVETASGDAGTRTVEKLLWMTNVAKNATFWSGLGGAFALRDDADEAAVAAMENKLLELIA